MNSGRIRKPDHKLLTRQGASIKVLHILPSLARRYGGPSTTIVPLVRHLRQKGLTVDIATTDADGPDACLNQATLPPDLKNAHLFKRDFSETWKYSRQLSMWLEEHIREYDLVHVHALWSYSTQTAARTARTQKVPCILRPAGMLSAFTWANKGLRKQLYWQLIERRSVMGAQAFHATSPQERLDILAVRKDADVHVIPNSIEDAAFEYPVVEKKQQTPPQILFLSRLHPVKGIVDRLLPAIQQLDCPFQLNIIGDEDTHYRGHRAEILAAMSRLNLADRVNLISGVSGNDRWAYFDQATVFVLPSHSENFGIVVAEAMARGCPFIITPEVQAAPLFGQSGAGMVVSGVEELTAAMESILTSPNEQTRLSHAGKSFAMNHFSGSSVADKIIGMYHKAVDAHAR